MKTYFLPEKIAPNFNKAFGTPLYGNNLSVANQYNKFIKEKIFLYYYRWRLLL